MYSGPKKHNYQKNTKKNYDRSKHIDNKEWMKSRGENQKIIQDIHHYNKNNTTRKFDKNILKFIWDISLCFESKEVRDELKEVSDNLDNYVNMYILQINI